jgi:hypothetical protein
MFGPAFAETTLVRSLRDAIGRYPELMLSEELKLAWIEDAKRIPESTTMSGTMLVCVWLIMYLSKRSLAELQPSDILEHSDTVFAPYAPPQDMPLDEQLDLVQRQQADTWRLVRRLQGLQRQGRLLML